MDQFSDRLDRLADLSEDELKSLESELATSFEAIDKETLTPEVVSTMKDHVEATKRVREEAKGRKDQAAELANVAAELTSAMSSDVADGDDKEEEVEEAIEDEAELAADKPEEEEKKEEAKEPEKETEASADVEDAAELSASEEEVAETPKTEAELSADETPEAELSAEEETVNNTPNEAELSASEIVEESSEEPVTASANTKGLSTPEGREPKITLVEPTRLAVSITAGADIPNTPMGSQLPNMRAVAQALMDRKRAWGNTTGGDGEKSTVAKFTTSYPEDRVLDDNDINGNRKKVDAVLASAMEARDAAIAEHGIVAAGGIVPSMVENRYELFSFNESTDRPVRDSLLVFNADRGGIRYITPPVIEDVKGSVSLWTIQDDIDAAANGATKVKPCIRVTAGEEVKVYVEAIPLCLTFGNLQSRTYPELVERHTELAMIWHARYAETRLLTRIGQLSTAVTTDVQLGAARDIFAAVDTAAAAMRNRNRIDSDAPLRAMFPEWFKNALRVDLIKQLPGDGRDGTFNLADAEINTWFASRKINVTWFIDGEEGQILGEQAAGALNAFPATLIWYLFPEGTFLFLDGGELDLGLVRDSTLNGTNDYKIFLETFEGVAKVGIESLRITSDLALVGASSGTVDLITAPADGTP